MVLCADAVLDGEALIGDPTEGALIVLGAKGGLDVDATRQDFPRIAEVPFDSEYKFMATFHEMTGNGGEPVVRCYVKGAPDVLIDRGGSYRSPDGALVPVTDENRHLALEANDRMANSGQRVMVVAQRDFDPAHVPARRWTCSRWSPTSRSWPWSGSSTRRARRRRPRSPSAIPPASRSG